ncbi:hypothetical protein RB195_020371 [Necator americanus]|uniref:Uncharacterized protein n=1 Tax=Necator americanus TaxID=51031 RepID=A0ABR1CII6_NECAM
MVAVIAGNSPQYQKENETLTTPTNTITILRRSSYDIEVIPKAISEAVGVKRNRLRSLIQETSAYRSRISLMCTSPVRGRRRLWGAFKLRIWGTFAICMHAFNIAVTMS